MNYHLKSLAKLVSLAGPPLGGEAARVSDNLGKLLALKNGFFAFESALHVFPDSTGVPTISLDQWNADTLWKNEYGSLAQGMFFFAEDIFGNQFALHNSWVFFFDAETGQTEKIADSVGEWAEMILSDYEQLTSYPVAHWWQKQHGPINPGSRLMLKRPLALGGDYALENVFEIDRVEGMRTRGHIARQLKNLPDGTQIQFKVVD